MLKQEFKIAKQLVLDAGALAKALQGVGVVRYKANFEGPVTEGDLGANELIIKGLAQDFPKDIVISEENFLPGDHIPESGRVWFVDPIDGTKNYVSGGQEYAVMLGLCVDRVPVLGFVFAPATNTLWQASSGHAEHIDANGQSRVLDISQKPINPKGLVLAVGRHQSKEFSAFISKNLPASKIIQRSSTGLKIAMVADGEADAYVSSTRHIKLWDTCAPCAILAASGGTFQAVTGEKLEFSGSIQHGIEIFAATPHAKALFSKKIEGAINQWVTLKNIRK